MVGSPRTTGKPPAWHTTHDAPPNWWSRAKAVSVPVLLFSHRILLRRGPRPMRLIGTVVVGFLVVIYLLLSDSYSDILTWSAGEKPYHSADLRIVVFGSQDVLGSARDGDARTTWPEHLCRELKCESLLSFVPPLDSEPGLTVSAVYNDSIQALDRLNRAANITAVPASDKFYVVEHYPVPQTPDLAEQVRQFLSMAPPDQAPRETLWVFSFGTWDIWNLAARSPQTGDSVLQAAVSAIFEQIELLYLKSLDPKSVAYSDFWSHVRDEDIDALTRPALGDKSLDTRKVEGFRVLIPEMLDITLTPGWQKRSVPSLPYTRSMELRNAARLTRSWNKLVAEGLEDWRRTKNQKPASYDEPEEEEGEDVPTEWWEGQGGEEEEDDDDDDDDAGGQSATPDAEASRRRRRRRRLSRLRSNQRREDAGSRRVVYAPYPLRLGLHATFTGAVVAAMMEHDMQQSGTRDGRGRGTLPASDLMSFPDVRSACVSSSAVTANSTRTECEAPDQHLFYTDFVLGQRASERLAKKAAEYLHDQKII